MSPLGSPLYTAAEEISTPTLSERDGISALIRDRLMPLCKRTTKGGLGEWEIGEEEIQKLSLLCAENPVAWKLLRLLFPELESTPSRVTSALPDRFRFEMIRPILSTFAERISALLGCSRDPVEGCWEYGDDFCTNVCDGRKLRTICQRHPLSREMPIHEARDQIRRAIAFIIQDNVNISAHFALFLREPWSWRDFVLQGMQVYTGSMPKIESEETRRSRIELFSTLASIVSMLSDIESYLLSADASEKKRISDGCLELYERAFFVSQEYKGEGIEERGVEIEDMMRLLPQSLCDRYRLRSKMPLTPIE